MKCTSKAEKGDLIRIKDDAWIVLNGYADAGGIYEVVYEESDGSGVGLKGILNGESFTEHHEYEIFRKAGEEDSEADRLHAEIQRLMPSNNLNDAQLTQANRIRSACSELAELLVRKNHDYGDSFSQQYAKYGLMSALIRMDDKMRRLETLQQAENKAQVDESIGDTLLDLAGYAILTYVEQSKSK